MAYSEEFPVLARSMEGLAPIADRVENFVQGIGLPLLEGTVRTLTQVGARQYMEGPFIASLNPDELLVRLETVAERMNEVSFPDISVSLDLSLARGGGGGGGRAWVWGKFSDVVAPDGFFLENDRNRMRQALGLPIEKPSDPNKIPSRSVALACFKTVRSSAKQKTIEGFLTELNSGHDITAKIGSVVVATARYGLRRTS